MQLRRNIFAFVPLWLMVVSFPLRLFGRDTEVKFTEKRVISTFVDYVRQIRFSPFGNYFAITSGDNTVTLYNRFFEPIWKSQGNRKSVGGKVSFSPDEKYMAFTRYKSIGDIGILDIEKLQVVQHLQEHSYYVNSIDYSPDGRYLVSGASDYHVILWKKNGSGFEKYQVFKEHTKPVNAVLFSPDQQFLVSGSEDGTVIVRILKDGNYEVHQILEHNKYGVESMSFSPDGSLLATSISNAVTIWKNDSGRFIELQRITHHSGGSYSLEFSPDGRLLAAPFSNGSVRFWENKNGLWQESYNIYRHSANVFDTTFSPDGRLLATGSSDMTAIFWEAQGIAPDPVLFLMQMLGRNFTSAQKHVVGRMTGRQILDHLDQSLTAPKDEFETTTEYSDRMNTLRSHILRALQLKTEELYGVVPADQKKEEERIVHGLKLERYNADTGVYEIEVLGTKGRIRIQPAEARLLKKNAPKVSVMMKRVLDPDGVSYDYSGFVLIHPANGKKYTIALDENPFKGPVIGKLEEESRRVELKSSVSGPSLELGNIEFNDIFPVFYKYYDEHPIGTALLYNNGTKPVESITVRLFIKQYMDNPKLCRAPETLAPGEKSGVDLFGLFTNRVLDISEGNKVSVKITIDYSAEQKEYHKEYVDTIRLNNRNAITWDDDRKVSAFVTARDSEVLRFSKNVTGMIQGHASNALNSRLIQAIGMYEGLRAYGINYVVDPNTPYREFSKKKAAVDFIQFPVQTLQYKAGDCDDLSILYNALLQSVGIKTSFITIPGHIYSAFSINLRPETADKLFTDTHNFLFRDGDTWVPVELTVLNEGFLHAWEVGAREWQENSGKARFYSTEEAWKIYEPVGFQQKAAITLPDKKTITDYFQQDVIQFVKIQIQERENALLARMERSGETVKLLNSLGVLYARYGLEEKALQQFDRILRDEDFIPALINTGNIYYLRGDYKAALGFYEKAYKKDRDNPKVLLSVSRAQYRLGNRTEAKKMYGRLKSIDPNLALSVGYLEGGDASEARASSFSVQDEFLLWDE